MTEAAYEQLLILLRQAVNDSPPDDQIRRLAKGLSKALARWLRLQSASPVQARTGMPRSQGLAAVNASLASPVESSHGKAPRPQGADPDR